MAAVRSSEYRSSRACQMPRSASWISSSVAPPRDECAQIRAAEGEQACEELSLRRQASTCAVAAERLGDRGDHPDLGAAVAVAPAIRDLAAIRGLDRGDAELRIEGRDDLGGRHDVVEAPAVRVPDVHVLDEPKRLAAVLEEGRHRHDLVVVHASLDDRIHLHRETGCDRGVDALDHLLDREVGVVEGPEGRIVERVEADGHAVETGVREQLGLGRQERAVRRQRQFDAEAGKLFDQPLEVAAHERLAAGDPDLARPQGDEDARPAA